MTKHPLKVRVFVALLMLVTAFLGVVFSDSDRAGEWDFWKWAAPVYALLALGLSYFIKRDREGFSLGFLWHELLHWMSLVCAIWLVSYLSRTGVMSRFVVSIVDLILISLTVFLAGIYIDPVFYLVGVALAAVAVLTAVFVEYMFSIALVVLIGSVLIAAIWGWISHKRKNFSS